MRMFDLLGGVTTVPTEEDGVSWVGFISPYFLARHEAPHWGWPKFEHWLAYHHTVAAGGASEPFVLASPRAHCCPS